MTKRIFSFISLTLTLCLFFSTTVLATESGTITNMTYEEWLVEQESVDNSANEVVADMQPVIISAQEQRAEVPQVYNAENQGIVSLVDILREKGRYELDRVINADMAAGNIAASITNDMDIARSNYQNYYASVFFYLLL